jgi:hypothetical protein
MSFDPFSKSGLVEKRPCPLASAPTPKKHKVSASFSAMHAATKATAKPAVVTQTGLAIKPHARSIVEGGQSTLDTHLPRHAARARQLEGANDAAKSKSRKRRKDSGPPKPSEAVQAKPQLAPEDTKSASIEPVQAEPQPTPKPVATVIEGPSVLDTVPPKQYDMFCSTELFDTNRLLICIELADELGLHEDHIAQAKAYLKQSERSQLNVYYDNNPIGLFTTKISDPPALMKLEAYKTAKAALDNLDPDCTPEERARLYQKVQHSQLRGALTQMNMHKLIRASICEPLYEDLDFVDCGPSITRQVLTALGIEAPIWDQFSATREQWLEKAMHEHGLTRSQAKELFTPIFYGAGKRQFKLWCEEHDVDPTTTCAAVQMRHKLVKEYHSLCEKLCKHACMQPYVADAKLQKKEFVHGSAVANMSQTVTKHLLMQLRDICIQREVTIGAYINDGLHVQKTRKGLAPSVLAHMETEITKTTGFRTKLKVKPFDVPQIVKTAYIANDMVSAGEYLRQTLKLQLFSDNGTLFYYHDEEKLWIAGISKQELTKIEQLIRRRIHHGPYIFERRGPALARMNTNDRPAREYTKYLLDNPTPRPGMQREILDSCRGKLAFLDGFWVFERKQFFRWEDMGRPKMLTLCNTGCMFPRRGAMLWRRAKVLLRARRLEGADWERFRTEHSVVRKVLMPLFNDVDNQIQFNLQQLARTMAGNNSDKRWIINLGARNAGKSVLMDLLQLTFGAKYVRTANSANFYEKTGSGTDEAKLRSWLLDHLCTRCMFTNEFQSDAETGLKALSGELIKAITGCDEICARKNFADETYFQIPATLWMNANDIPPIKPADALETVVLNKWPCEFVDTDNPKLTAPMLGTVARAKDPQLKEKLGRYCHEFLWLILTAWRPCKPAVPTCMISDNEAFTDDADVLQRTFYGMFDLGLEHALQTETMTHDDISRAIGNAIHDLKGGHGVADHEVHPQHQQEYDRLTEVYKTSKVKRGQWLFDAGCGIPKRQSTGSRPWVFHYITLKGESRKPWT